MDLVEYKNLYNVNNTGIYVNPQMLANKVRHWMETTPDKVKREQIEEVAIIGFSTCAAVLVLLALTKK